MTDRERNYWRAQLADRLDTHPMNEWNTTLLKAVCWIMDVALERDQPTTPHGRPKLAVVR